MTFPRMPKGKLYTDLTIAEQKERADEWLNRVEELSPRFAKSIEYHQNREWLILFLYSYADLEIRIVLKTQKGQIVSDNEGRFFREE